MRIFFDCRMLFMSGIGRYLQNILTYFPCLQDDLRFTLAGEPGQIDGFLKKEPALRGTTREIVNFSSPVYSPGEQVYGSLLLCRYAKKNDICHFPHYSVPWLVPENSVVTVHDLTHFRFPEYFGRAKVKLAGIILRNAVKKVGKIIVISRSTANDLERMFPGINYKCRLIYQGVADFFRPRPENVVENFKKKRSLNRYLLYVGNRKPHKNLGRLLQAYSSVERKIPDLQLVIAGKKFEPRDEVTQFQEKNKLPGIIEIEEAADEELLNLYCGAEALVLPSLYEGFGLSPLEAMACGTPTAVSKVASLPEVVGDAGFYFDPSDVRDMAQVIYRVLTDQHLRQHLHEKGLARVRFFTWEKVARQTLEVYQEVLNKRRKNLKFFIDINYRV